jgi:hypothetical protein
MEKQLLGRGALAGAAAGLVAFIFARIFAEPVIQRAIDYESGRDAAQNALDRVAGKAVEAAGPDIFSRTVQADVGIGVGLILFGAAMGALVAIAFVICIGRTGNVRPRPLALLVAAGGFVGIYLVPFMKYPANPPAIGHEETIRDRGFLYMIMVFCAVFFLAVAVRLGQRLAQRYGNWNASTIVAVGYLVAIGIVMLLLPSLGHLHDNVVEYGRHATETPLPLRGPDGKIVYPGFPADVLAQFRAYSVANQLILWGLIGVFFAPLAERVLKPTGRSRHEVPSPAGV